jgi:thymidylate synthase (FAD)
MSKLVMPETFMVGHQVIDEEGLKAYLKYTKQDDFLASWTSAREQGLSDGEILSSMYAKLCYKSLVIGKNANITRVRDIPDNLVGCFVAGHGSVFGHCMINFITTDCSRVFTHELVRNHIGTEYSQTSGRYVRLDQVDLILDPILDKCKDLVTDTLKLLETRIYLIECTMGLRVPPTLKEDLKSGTHQAEVNSNPMYWSNWSHDEEISASFKWVPNDKMDFNRKKKITSAIRRIAPNGQTNEIGWSINLRALRHVIQMRTSRHAEWEIRRVMNQVYHAVKARYPLIFWGAKTKEIDGLLEVYGMKTQPYTLSEEEVLKAVTVTQLRDELALREASEGHKELAG